MDKHADLMPSAGPDGAACVERSPVMLDDLPSRTRWVARAEVEVDIDDIVRGLLSHDGETVRFCSFQRRLEWAAPVSSLFIGADEVSVKIGATRYRVGGIHPLGGTPPAWLTQAAATRHFGRPMYGFLVSLGLDV